MNIIKYFLVLLLIPTLHAAVTCPLPAGQSIQKESDLGDNAKLTKLMADLKSKLPGGVKSENFISCLPEAFKKRYVLVTESGSLQGAKPSAPRVIIYGNSGKTMLSFSPVESPDSIEIMQYNDNPGKVPRYQWEPKVFSAGSDKEWKFSSGNNVAGGHGGTKSCVACHGTPIRPKFDSYDRWPNTYSSISVGGKDAILPHECDNYMSFLSAAQKDPNSPYGAIPLQKPKEVERLPNKTCMVKDGAGTSPAGHLNHLLNEMNLHRVADEITTNKNYKDFKYLFQSASRGCGAYKQDLPMPEQGKFGLFGNSMPKELYNKLNCEGLKKEMAVIVENNFLNQVKELKGVACTLPDNAPNMQGNSEKNGLPKQALFREREAETGLFYFILPKENCDPSIKGADFCKKKCLDYAGTTEGLDELRPMKLVESLGSARFEQAVQFCCAAKAIGQDCKKWSLASRGESTDSYEFEDGMSGILKLGNILMQKEKEEMKSEGVDTGEVDATCCKDVATYLYNNQHKKSCPKYEFSSPQCSGVTSIKYGSKKLIAPPYLASSCREDQAGLDDYANRAKECFALAEKSREQLTQKADQDNCEMRGLTALDPNFTKPYDHLKNKTLHEEKSRKYAEKVKCPAPSYNSIGGQTSDMSRLRPDATAGESRGGIKSEPKHPFLSGDL